MSRVKTRNATSGELATVTPALIGSIIVVHWQTTPVAQPHDTLKTPVEARALFHLNMLQRGYYLARRGFMALSLALTEADHDGFIAAVDDYCGAYRNVLREL